MVTRRVSEEPTAIPRESEDSAKLTLACRAVDLIWFDMAKGNITRRNATAC